jgi:hypothetical protein
MIHSMMPETALDGCDLKRVELPTWKGDSLWGLALHTRCFPAFLGGIALVKNKRRSSNPSFRCLGEVLLSCARDPFHSIERLEESEMCTADLLITNWIPSQLRETISTQEQQKSVIWRMSRCSWYNSLRIVPVAEL